MDKTKTVIIHLVANKVWGGGEQYVYDLIDNLKNEPWCQVSVVCKKSDIVIDRLSALSVDIRQMNLNGYMDIKSVVALSKMLNQVEGRCIIHAHDFKRAFIAVLAKKLSKNKYVSVVMTRHLVRKAKKSFFENIVYRNVDRIFFVSDLAKQEFLSSKPNIDYNKCVVVLSGVKDVACDPRFLRDEYGISDDEFVMMYHGRIVSEKGVDVIVDALSQIKDTFKWRMVFVGDDTSEYALSVKKHISSFNMDRNIIWAGYQKNVVKYIGGCDLGIVPTIAQEAFGLSVVEYMMAGKAVVTTSHGAQKEYIQNGTTGVLIPASDSKALVDSIVSVCQTGSFKHIGSNARAYYEQHLTYKVFYNKLLEEYLRFSE